MIPKHSSTKGILISMALFKQVEYDENTKNVVVGAGCLWEDVADNPKMKRYKRCVVGGATGVGVAGWMLGGGYSLKTNQYGLGIDNVVEFEVVTPMAQIRKAVMGTDLFNALRVGTAVMNTSQVLLTSLHVGRRQQFRYCYKVYLADTSSGRHMGKWA